MLQKHPMRRCQNVSYFYIENGIHIDKYKKGGEYDPFHAVQETNIHQIRQTMPFNIKQTIVKCIIENMIASWSYPKGFRRF